MVSGVKLVKEDRLVIKENLVKMDRKVNEGRVVFRAQKETLERREYLGYKVSEDWTVLKERGD